MSMILDGCAISDSSDIGHLSWILRPCLCVCLDHGITKKIITTLSINSHELEKSHMGRIALSADGRKRGMWQHVVRL